MEDSKGRKDEDTIYFLGRQSSVFLKLRKICKFVLSFDSIITIGSLLQNSLKVTVKKASVD